MPDVTSTPMWIDSIILDAIDYFSGMTIFFGQTAVKYTGRLCMVMLILTALKLAFSRTTIKDALFSIATKFFFVFLLVTFYTKVTPAIPQLANSLATAAGGGKQILINSLINIRDNMNNFVNAYSSKESSTERKIEDLANTLKFDLPPRDAMPEYNKWLAAANTKFSEWESEGNVGFGKEARQKSKELRELLAYSRHSVGENIYNAIYVKNLEALANLLIEKDANGTPVNELSNDQKINLTGAYFDLNIYMRAGKNEWLSPAALLRVGVFVAQYIWEKPDLGYAERIEEINSTGFGFHPIQTTTESVMYAVNKLFMGILALIIIAAISFAMIQYTMTIIEFHIICAIGAFLLPFVVLDVTKELPKKLVPVFMGFFFKILIMVICVFFSFWTILNYVTELMVDTGGIHWSFIATGLVNAILIFVMTQSAPQIAQTLMTGQPQLSMGEFMAAAGTLAGGAMMGTRAAKAGIKAAAAGVRGTANGLTDAKGSLIKASSAASEASRMQKTGELDGKGNAAKAFATSLRGDIAAGARQKGSNFLHGSKGGETAAHTPTGTTRTSPGSSPSVNADNTNNNEVANNNSSNEQVTRPISNTSNANFKDAKIYNPDTMTQRDMTHKEFYQEKEMQGRNIALAMKDKQDAKKNNNSSPHPPIYNASTVESLNSANIRSLPPSGLPPPKDS